MFSRKELRRIYTSHLRTPLGIAALILGVAGLAGFVGFAIRQEVAGYVDNGLFVCGPMLCMLLAILLGCIWLIRSVRRLDEDDRLRCPHCDAAFALRLGAYRRWVLQTGRCCECGLAVATDALPSEPHSRTRFEAARARHATRLPFEIGYRALAGLMGFVFLAWAFYEMYHDGPGPLRPYRDPAIFLLPPMLLLAFLGPRLFPEQPLFKCPHCGDKLNVKCGIESDHCSRCQRRALADDPLGVEPSPPGG